MKSRAQTAPPKRPLNKGPYGFEHPEVIDVGLGHDWKQSLMIVFSGPSLSTCVPTVRTQWSSMIPGGVLPLTYTFPCKFWHQSFQIYSELCLYICSICTSNLSDFSKSPSINNFGPNLTIIFIPGSRGKESNIYFFSTPCLILALPAAIFQRLTDLFLFSWLNCSPSLLLLLEHNTALVPHSLSTFSWL